jgi:hypothetical protein
MTGGVELSYGQLRKLQVQMLDESEVDDDKASADENIDEKALEAAAAARQALTSLGTVWTISENSRLERDDSRLDSAAFPRKDSMTFSRETPP